MNLSKSILAACAFAAVLSACNNTCKKDESKSEVANCNKAAGSCKETNSQSIVFVNTDSLLNNYEYFKKIKSQLDEKSKKAKADYVTKHFNDLKAMMQISIADAFAKAMNEFANQNCEYYCEIKLAPEPINKLEC